MFSVAVLDLLESVVRVSSEYKRDKSGIINMHSRNIKQRTSRPFVLPFSTRHHWTDIVQIGVLQRLHKGIRYECDPLWKNSTHLILGLFFSLLLLDLY